MANLVRFESKPDLRDPILIEGLPGVGNVGKISSELICKQLGGKRMCTIYSDLLPTQILPGDDCMAKVPTQELWYVKDVGGKDLVFLLGECQSPTNDGQFLLAQDVMDILLPYSPSLVITLGGFATGVVPDDPRILGLVNDPKLRTRMEECGVGFYDGEPKGGVIGAAAAFLTLATAYDIGSVCLICDTQGYLVDYKSARKFIGVLSKVLGIEVDTAELQPQIDNIDNATSKIMDSAQPDAPEDLSYIG